jgi:hypothetical protein
MKLDGVAREAFWIFAFMCAGVVLLKLLHLVR